ncbi:MAG TPA: hypothetical protein VFK69_03710 [Candidatus Eisenbacteria bacterium]|nr:hypothetical protein [Candidatus Eisenbacteria bacterium]
MVRVRPHVTMTMLMGLLVALAGSRALGQDALHLTPAGQPPLAVIADDSLGGMRQRFNQLADRPRMLVMFSPT